MSSVVAAAFRESGIVVRESFGTLESFEKTSNAVRMVFSKDSGLDIAEANVIVVAVGWGADTDGLGLTTASVEGSPRGFVRVNSYLRTSAPHVFAAVDITGGLTVAKARETHDVVIAVMRFDETARTIIDGRTSGFCKPIADRTSRAILGCHVVGERAVEIPGRGDSHREGCG